MKASQGEAVFAERETVGEEMYNLTRSRSNLKNERKSANMDLETRKAYMEGR